MAAFDWSSSPNKLYYGVGNQVAYLEFSDEADNPNSYLPTNFEPQGYLTTSWIVGGLEDIYKIISSLWVHMDRFRAAGLLAILVDYETDKSGFWTYMEVEESNRLLHAFKVFGGEEKSLKTASVIGSPGAVTAVSDQVVTLNGVGSIAKGDWIRVGEETRHVSSVSGSNVTAVGAWERAAVGDTVTSGYPTGRMARFRLRFFAGATVDAARIMALRLNYANTTTSWLQYQFDILAETNKALLDRGDESRTANTIHDEIEALVGTNALVDFVDPWGTARKVQIINAQTVLSSFEYNVESGTRTIESRELLTLMEV